MANRVLRTTAFLLAAALLAAHGCDTSDETPAGPGSGFQLTVPMLDLDQVVEFLPFGFFGGGHLNPTYEFRTSSAAVPVFASAPGIVEAVELNESASADWEVRVRHAEQTAYLVIYDHVNDVVVTAGQRVAAGDRLGRIGNFAGGRGRTELQVNVAREGGAGDKTICPRLVGSTGFNAAHEAAFARAGSGGSVCLLDEFLP